MYLHNCSRCKFGILYNCCRLLCQCNHVTSFDGPVHKKHYTYSNSPKLTKYHLIQKINFNLLCIRSFFILWSVILQRITKWYYNIISVNCCGMRNIRKKNHMHEWQGKDNKKRKHETKSHTCVIDTDGIIKIRWKEKPNQQDSFQHRMH